ncbi:GNAT family N-acetyltransferase [Marinobacterium arenosum]|uniref:GNAT family N-acetyltransferase n=1 Tax=Marinobacterium arenosum TaxID=2862496 RepID=UPI001C94B2F8|nr:GNAT family N-acetyltransferase [Marinobacterium arenosum]MBY4675339.1 GNAT family N-acetyltransferase [Marinobacterium arenosum]
MRVNISESISLEPLAISDAEELFPLIDSDRSSLGEYLYWVDSVVDVETTREYIKSRVNSGLAGASWYKIKFLSSTVGVFGVKIIHQDEATAEIGYWLHSAYHGNGIVSQSVSGISQHLKLQHSIRRIEFRCLEKNRASISVALRAGGECTGMIPDYRIINGVLQNLNVYTAKLSV